MNIIIDTDVGHDDLKAIAFLLNRKDINVEAITIVNGLAHVETGAQIIAKLLTLAGREDIPVYAGHSKPLEGNRAFPGKWRESSEKLNGVNLPDSYQKLQQESAVEFLLKRIKEKQKPVSILAIGPLTNIADVFMQNNEQYHSVERIVIMGGALEVPGNVFSVDDFTSPTDKVEWNFFVDPLAVKIVYESPVNILTVPLDATNKVPVDYEFIKLFKNRTSNPSGKFVYELLESIEHLITRGHYFAWDPLAAVSLVENHVVKTKKMFVEIETDSPDSGRLLQSDTGKMKTDVAIDADRDKFIDIFTKAFF